MTLIRSKNAEYQQIEALKLNRRKRSRMGLVFVEGVQAINAAVTNGLRFRSAVVDGERRLSRWGERVAARAETVSALSSALMSELSDKDDPSEVIALVERPVFDPVSLSRDAFLWVLFDRPSSEGNLGSIVRTCDAFGADAVVTTGHGVDPFDPKTIRASLGTIFNLPVGHLELPALRTLIESVPAAAVIGTSARATTPVTEAGLCRPIIVCLGNETRGLSRAIQDLCTLTVGIEMRGLATSLNVAAAAAIVLHEVDRARERRQ